MPLTRDLQKIGRRLLAYRRNYGLTQAQAAEASGLSERAYAKIERGESDMRIVTAIQICEALHISLDDLFFEDGIENYKDDIQKQLANCSPSELKIISLIVKLLLKPEE